jgi:hypothetical protein
MHGFRVELPRGESSFHLLIFSPHKESHRKILVSHAKEGEIESHWCLKIHEPHFSVRYTNAMEFAGSTQDGVGSPE